VGNNATLYNGVTWHDTGPGYFNFNPSSLQFAEAANTGNLSSWTVECWFRTTQSLASYSFPALVTTTYDNGQGTGYGQINYVLSPYINGGNTITAGYYNGSWHNTSNYTITQGTWYQMAGTFDGTTMKLYVNGSETSSVSGDGSSQANGGPIRIARRWDGGGEAQYFLPADIATVRVYNTALTSAEVLQNYNTERGRFGL
jgi:hypothetical protein